MCGWCPAKRRGGQYGRLPSSIHAPTAHPPINPHPALYLPPHSPAHQPVSPSPTHPDVHPPTPPSTPHPPVCPPPRSDTLFPPTVPNPLLRLPHLSTHHPAPSRPINTSAADLPQPHLPATRNNHLASRSPTPHLTCPPAELKKKSGQPRPPPRIAQRLLTDRP